jgi:hypothetical protein
MKKLRIDFLFAAALLLGGGLAVANDAMTTDPNVFNAAAEGQPADWQPIDGQTVTCEANPSRECTGLQVGGTVSVIDYGNTRVQ